MQKSARKYIVRSDLERLRVDKTPGRQEFTQATPARGSVEVRTTTGKNSRKTSLTRSPRSKITEPMRTECERILRQKETA